MNKFLRIIVAIPGVLFVIVGLSWLIDPVSAAKNLGMPLLDGLGRSSQIGDFGAFFTVGGAMVLIGVITQKRTWLHAPAMMLCGAAVFRTLAWAMQGAAFAAPQIAVEVVLAVFLLFATSRLPSEK